MFLKSRQCQIANEYLLRSHTLSLSTSVALHQKFFGSVTLAGVKQLSKSLGFCQIADLISQTGYSLVMSFWKLIKINMENYA